MKLDGYDVKILQTIQQEGRITKTRLAEKICLSPSPTWERLKRLEESGVIAGYHGSIHLKEVVPVVTVMVEVVLKRHQQSDFKRFEEAIASLEEITECLAIGGGMDYLMRVVVADIDTYQRFMDTLLDAGLGIDKYFTYIVTKSVKPSSGLPLKKLLEKTTASSP